MRYVAAGVIALALAGCATLAPPPAALPSLTEVPAAFEMSGRLAVRQGDRSDIAKLRWTHRAAADEWSISSPIGNEVARIESDADGAVLTEATGGTEHAPSFESLTQKLIGVPLSPVLLAAWLHGDVRNAPAEWRVSIEETQQAGAVPLARRLTATRGDVVVRLVVDEYNALAR